MDQGGIKMVISTNHTNPARERSRSHPDGQDLRLGTRPVLGCGSPSVNDLGSRRLGIPTRGRRRCPATVPNRQDRPRDPLPHFRPVSRMGTSEDKIPIVTGLSDPAGIGVWSIYRIAPVLRTGQRDELFRWVGERLGGTDRVLGRE